jgi:hypothetical protein
MKVDINGNPLTNRVDEIIVEGECSLSLEVDTEGKPVVVINWLSEDGNWFQMELTKHKELLNLSQATALAADYAWLKTLEAVPPKEK